jgi:GntP family gluconate:H+ symporter
VAEKLGIDLIWFGVLLGVNMQTSFMHPPFGFALFYLRSVAPMKEYDDRVTGKKIDPVTTMQIYWGAVPFVIIQVVMVALIIFVPTIVSSGLDKTEKVDLDQVQLQMDADSKAVETPDAPAAAMPESSASGPADAAGAKPEEDDPMKALQESMDKDSKKK